MKQKLKPDWFCYLDNARIGSGWRVISVRKFGWKWLFLQDWGSKTNFKMTFAKWELIIKCPMENVEGDWKALWKKKGKHKVPIWGVESNAKRPAPQSKSRRKSIKKSRISSTNKAKQKERSREAIRS